jgi:chemotaxis protein MotB
VNARLAIWLVLAPLFVGCGRSEFEWQQKLREIDALNGKAQRAGNDQRRFDEEQTRSQEEIAQLKAILAAQSRQDRTAEQRAGVERASLEQQLIEQMRVRSEVLRRRLDALGKGGVSVAVRRGRLTVLIVADGLFEKGATELAPRGRETLKVVAEAIAADPSLSSRNFLVVGHTDKASEREATNWTRSFQRATAVREFLVGKRGGLTPGRWGAVGRGSLEPVALDDSPEAKARNQRIELALEPDPIELPDYSRSIP